VSRALILLALIAGCAVPELDRGGAIVCGTNNLCPSGFTCELGRCCPADAGVSCPTLRRACAGSRTGSGCIDAENIYANCSMRTGASCGALECVPRSAIPGAGICTVPSAQSSTVDMPCRVAANVGGSCWDGKGVCVAASQLGLNQGIFPDFVCLVACTPPAGQSQSSCGALAVCQRLAGLSSSVCVPDCRATGCQSGSTCDRTTGTCRQ